MVKMLEKQQESKLQYASPLQGSACCLPLSHWPKQVTRASPVSGWEGTTQSSALILWQEGKRDPLQLWI